MNLGSKEIARELGDLLLHGRGGRVLHERRAACHEHSAMCDELDEFLDENEHSFIMITIKINKII